MKIYTKKQLKPVATVGSVTKPKTSPAGSSSKGLPSIKHLASLLSSIEGDIMQIQGILAVSLNSLGALGQSALLPLEKTRKKLSILSVPLREALEMAQSSSEHISILQNSLRVAIMKSSRRT